jgi:hypothetical protein
VLPRHSMYDVTYRARRDAVLMGNGTLGASLSLVEGTNLAHLHLGKLCIAMLLTTGVRFWMRDVFSSPLVVHVPHIIRLAAQEQMSRVDAGANVAAMKHTQFFRDSPEAKFKRNAMRPCHVSLSANLAVAFAALTASPQPAAIRAGALVHLFPEAFRKRTGRAFSMIADTATELAITTRRMTFGNCKVVTTNFANTVNHDSPLQKGNSPQAGGCYLGNTHLAIGEYKKNRPVRYVA